MGKKTYLIKKKKKNYHVRFIIAALVFLLGTLALVVPLTLFLLDPDYVASVYVSLIILVCIDFVCSIFILNSGSQVDFKVSWLTVMLCLPYVGAFLYILYAQKITTKRLKKNRLNKISKQLIASVDNCDDVLLKEEQEFEDASLISKYIYRSSVSAVYQNTVAEYFEFGELGFPKMLEELKKAKKFIFIEYFIIEDGEFFNSIYEILKEKAKEGVDVRFIYDDFGSVAKIDKNFYRKVRSDGIQCLVFNRVRPFVDIRQNSRDHRKILVIDGCVGFTGGCNLADEYINKVVRFGTWKDNIIMLKGSAVNGLTNVFLTSWALNKKFKKIENSKLFHFEVNRALHPEIELKDDGYFQPFGEVPFDSEDTSKGVYLAMINKAKKYVYLSTPYLIPDSELLTALENAAKSGIDVRIITPGIPDKKIVYQATKSYYAKLLICGVKIYEYKPGFNHTKMMVVDDNMGLTGTCNFDFRSFYLHFENCVFIANSSVIKNMKDDLDSMIANGAEQKENDYLNRPFIVKLFWALLRVIVPLF